MARREYDEEGSSSRGARAGGASRGGASAPITDTLEMISSMAPLLHSRSYVYAKLSSDIASTDLVDVLPEAHSLFNEDEGISLLLPVGVYEKNRSLFKKASSPLAHIELQVYSALEGIGLTASVSSALAAAEIPCNMVAAFQHDHVFVPEDDAEVALEVLKGVAKEAKAALRRSTRERDDY